MNIYVLQTGSTLVSSAVPDRSSKRWRYAYTDLFQDRNKRIEVPVKAFLVEANGHRVLIDTGWSPQCIRHPIKHLGLGLWFASEPVLKENETVLARIAKLNLKPNDLDAIILTHLDCDHVSGLASLKDAKKIYCSQEEWDIAQKGSMRYRKAFWQTIKIDKFNMSYDDKAPFKRSLDIFKDDSFIAYLTPGHSAGSTAVIVKENNKYAAFIGDDSYNRNSWLKQQLPGPLYNESDMYKTLKWVLSLSKDPNCLGIYASHDPYGPRGGKDIAIN